MSCFNEFNYDYGPAPHVGNVMSAAKDNKCFRTGYWTGERMQMTLMSIPVCQDIGLEVHMDTDQIIRVESGKGIVKMGENKEEVRCVKSVCVGDTVFVPAGVWHNIINKGGCPLKLSSIYAPPHHPRGVVHRTKEEAEYADE